MPTPEKHAQRLLMKEKTLLAYRQKLSSSLGALFTSALAGVAYFAVPSRIFAGATEDVLNLLVSAIAVGTVFGLADKVASVFATKKVQERLDHILTELDKLHRDNPDSYKITAALQKVQTDNDDLDDNKIDHRLDPLR